MRTEVCQHRHHTCNMQRNYISVQNNYVKMPYMFANMHYVNLCTCNVLMLHPNIQNSYDVIWLFNVNLLGEIKVNKHVDIDKSHVNGFISHMLTQKISVKVAAHVC